MNCLIEGCETKVWAKHLCSKHYSQQYERLYRTRKPITARRRISPTRAARRQIIRQYKLTAERKNRDISLSEDDWSELFESDCYYCGSPPSNVQTMYRYREDGGFEYAYNGVDRLDNTQGYHMFNVVPCCGVCNKMKLSMTPEDFIEHVKKIFRRMSSNG